MYWTRSPPEADSIYSVSSRNFLRTFHLLSTSVFSVEKKCTASFHMYVFSWKDKMESAFQRISVEIKRDLCASYKVSYDLQTFSSNKLELERTIKSGDLSCNKFLIHTK